MWSSYDRCREIVKHEWIDPSIYENENPVQMFSKKAKASLIELKTWSKNEFGGRKEEIRTISQ